MGDYADFNRQHSLPAQAAVFYAILDEFDTLPGVSPDLYRAVQWCAEALLNQMVYLPRINLDNRSYFVASTGPGYRVLIPTGDNGLPVVQGLFSGVRATNYNQHAT